VGEKVFVGNCELNIKSQQEKNPLVSVIIPARNEHPQVWFSVDSVQMQLRNVPHEILVIFNENTDRAPEYGKNRGCFLRFFSMDKGSVSQSRRFGAENAKGKYLFFLDSHVLLEENCVCSVLELFETIEDLGICWLSVRYLLGWTYAYGYKLQLNTFWGTWQHKKKSNDPWPCLMSGLAAAAARRDRLMEINNFHPALGIYGGSEPYISMKMEMFGYRNFVHPNAKAAHFVDKRGYCWNSSDFLHNFLLASYTLGGQYYFNIIKEKYTEKCKGVQRYIDELEKICCVVLKEGRDDRLFVKENAKYSLQEVFRYHGIQFDEDSKQYEDAHCLDE